MRPRSPHSRHHGALPEAGQDSGYLVRLTSSTSLVPAYCPKGEKEMGVVWPQEEAMPTALHM